MSDVTEAAGVARSLERLQATLGRCLRPVPAPGEPADAIGDGADREPVPAVADLIPAAVLVPLVLRPSGLHVLLTRRTDHLDKHAGQVSFPGGHVEPQDADCVATALRETEEETGLARAFITIAGALDECLTGTGYRIVPVVGLVRPGFTLAPDSFEVAEIFEVPLAHVLDPANHARRSGEFRGRRREFYVIEYAEQTIWGATAAMLVNLYDRARAADIVEMLARCDTSD